jgi:hypothetical protein
MFPGRLSAQNALPNRAGRATHKSCYAMLKGRLGGWGEALLSVFWYPSELPRPERPQLHSPGLAAQPRDPGLRNARRICSLKGSNRGGGTRNGDVASSPGAPLQGAETFRKTATQGCAAKAANPGLWSDALSGQMHSYSYSFRGSEGLRLRTPPGAIAGLPSSAAGQVNVWPS